MKILLVGFGYVGQALGSRLIRAGHEVSALRRSAQALDDYPRIKLYRGDASQSATLSSIPVDFDQVVCATSPDGRTRDAYARAYPQVVHSLRAALPRSRIILVSSTSVYDQQGGALLEEGAEAAGSTETAAQIRLAEEQLLTDETQPPLGHVVLRASGIYGPGRVRLISSLFHHDLPEESAQLWTSRIHRDDLAAIIHFLIDRQRESGVFHATDPNPAQLGEIAAWVRMHLSSAQLAPALAGVRERKNRRLIPARLKELGYPFLFPSFRDGYSDLFKG